MRTSARSVVVVVFDEIELLDLSGAVHVLSVAGRHWNWRPFRVFLASCHGLLVSTRNQLRIEAHGALEESPTPEILLVPGGYGARKLLGDDRFDDWLRRQGEQAELLGSVGSGGLCLMRAGWCRGGRLALPSDVHDVARELDPSVELTQEPGVVQSARLRSVAASGGSVDLGLSVVEHFLGTKQALALAERLGVPRSAAPERLELRAPLKPPGQSG